MNFAALSFETVVVSWSIEQLSVLVSLLISKKVLTHSIYSPLSNKQNSKFKEDYRTLS